MSIGSNLSTFCGKKVVDFDITKSVRNLKKLVYRLRTDYDTGADGMPKLLDAFAKTRLAPNVQELIIGLWDGDSDYESNQFLIEKLVALKDTFKQLKALFIGDITYSESEISWIKQSDISPIFSAYPNLEHFQVRGSENLSLGSLALPRLKTLIVETGGLPKNVIQEISNAQLPDLEHLEVWLGSDQYGFNSTIEDLETLISGSKFPKLKYLGLKNSILQDEIALKIINSPVLDRIEILDLSMGTLTDIGAQALLDSPKVRNLKLLNLNHHYMSDEMMSKMKASGIQVSIEDREDGYEYDGEISRYVEVGE